MARLNLALIAARALCVLCCVQYQRMTWDALRKSINGLINKVNAANIKHILPEVRGWRWRWRWRCSWMQGAG